MIGASLLTRLDAKIQSENRAPKSKLISVPSKSTNQTREEFEPTKVSRYYLDNRFCATKDSTTLNFL